MVKMNGAVVLVHVVRAALIVPRRLSRILQDKVMIALILVEGTMELATLIAVSKMN